MTKQYRHKLALPEALIWQRLRARPFGLIFRKQHKLSRLTLDFFCAERALAVEIDGIAHDMGDRPERDPRRDAWLRSQGIETLRIAASEVLKDADEVVDAIARVTLARPVVFNAPGRRRRIHPS